MAEQAWWKEAVVYQIYPRSFKDSNGDGIGDLPGILSELDYISSLGVNVIWLNPVYGSPNDDNGYDISDYQAIMPEFGTMEDFDRLLESLHSRKIKLVMDLVVNHTSDEHEWFKQARSSRENPYYNYYVWWPEEKGKPPHRESFFDERGEGWKYNPPTKSWYLHYFSAKQPDLNWDYVPMRRDIYKMMHWWFQKGIDGFRMDAVTFISKDPSFPVITKEILKKDYHGDWGYYYASGPKLHDYLHEMYEDVIGKYDVMTVAEGPGILSEHALNYVDEERRELHMLYHFEGMGIGSLPGAFKKLHPEGNDLIELKRVYSKWDKAFAERGWGTIYLGNHDQPRMTSRWGSDDPKFRASSAKMLLTFLLSMRATPFIYNGDELGMTNIRFDRIEDYRDIETRNVHDKIKAAGGDAEGFLKDQKDTARDNSRTPFQWNSEANAGFTDGTPWISVNPNFKTVNAAAEEGDPSSPLNYFRELTALRKKYPVLVYGQYSLLDPSHRQVYTYSRTWKGVSVEVVLNFSRETIRYELPVFFTAEDVLICSEGNCGVGDGHIELRPYEAIIAQIAPSEPD